MTDREAAIRERGERYRWMEPVPAADVRFLLAELAVAREALTEIDRRERRSEYSSLAAAPVEFAQIARVALDATGRQEDRDTASSAGGGRLSVRSVPGPVPTDREATIREEREELLEQARRDYRTINGLKTELAAARERADHLEEVMLEAEEKAREREQRWEAAWVALSGHPSLPEPIRAMMHRRRAALDATGGRDG